MAKNLKLNIKNAQLAEALNLSKLKKAPSAAKKAEKTEEEKPAPVEQTSSPAPKAPEVVAQPRETLEPPVQKTAEPQPPSAAPAAPREYKDYPPRRPSPPREGQEQNFRDSRPPYQQGSTQYRDSRPPYQGSSQQREYRPPYQGNSQQRDSRPPYQGSSPQREYRPPYQGNTQYRPPGSRPPFRPNLSERPVTTVLPKEPDRHERKSDKPFVKEFKEKEDAEKKNAAFKEYKDFKLAKKQDAKAFDSRDRQGLRESDSEGWRRKKNLPKKVDAIEEVDRPKSLSVKIPISVKDLAAEMKLKASQLIAKLFMQGVIITLNDFLDDETTIQLLGHEFDCEITIDTKEEKRLRITDASIKEEVAKADPSKLVLRPPLVTFMGHVDHGKTSLIDAIRKSNVAAGEAGAITQHIGAFQCHTAVGTITILDTPGHEAFSAMRSRGADVTDIVVLVIAGDEGIKTQTIEAMHQAQEAKVPIVVAMNKCDKPGFDAENIYRQLADHNLLPEAWGGNVITVKCSAVTKEGIKELLEMLALQAEILELKADPSSRARGSVIESEMHKGLGAVATVLVQNGTLKLGDAVVFNQHWGRIKTMHDEYDKEMTTAGPSTPVKITGLSGLPEAGNEFIAVASEKEARELSEGRIEGKKNTLALQTKRAGVENLLQQKAENQEKKILNLILRADVQGSLEALKTSLMKIVSKKAEVNIISAGIGEISESDIQLAAASKATIIGFHTQVESHAESLIKQTKVVIRLHDIIYHAVDDIRAIMKALLDKIPQETDTGSALVKATFRASQLGVIAGCQVIEGTIKRNHLIRLVRGTEVVWRGSIGSLKRIKEDVKEVSKGYECGILLNNYNDVKEGDIMQAYEITYLEQDL